MGVSCVWLTRVTHSFVGGEQIEVKSQWTKINGKLMVKKCVLPLLRRCGALLLTSRALALWFIRAGSDESGQDDYDLVTDDEGSDTSEISEMDTGAESEGESDVSRRAHAPPLPCAP